MGGRRGGRRGGSLREALKVVISGPAWVGWGEGGQTHGELSTLSFVRELSSDREKSALFGSCTVRISSFTPVPVEIHRPDPAGPLQFMCQISIECGSVRMCASGLAPQTWTAV